ncbi:MAG: hypothetical protein WAX04_07030, partial [Oscillospiraceae bacterium]
IGSVLRITIPTKKNWFSIIFLPIWLVGWLVGEVMISGQLLANEAGTPDLFLIVWLIGWTAGGAFAILAFLWQLVGKQVITLSSNILSVQNKILNMGILKNYDCSLIKNLKTLTLHRNSVFSYSGSMEFWGFGKGNIAFEYGMKMIRFAPFIDEPEARYVIEKLQARGLTVNL